MLQTDRLPNHLAMMDPIVQKLVALIDEHGWQRQFQQAIDCAASRYVHSVRHIRSLTDYLRYIDEMVRWAPREENDSRLVHDKLVEFHFFLDQPPLLDLQSAIVPAEGAQVLSPLSLWMKEYAVAWGRYLDTHDSAIHVQSFRDNPAFNWEDYMAPPSGYQTFNQFFARHVKPGKRPIAAIADDDVIASPSDASFMGAWPIDLNSTIVDDDGHVELKGLRWSIRHLLDESAFADRFAGGVFTRSALRTFDYHRWHAPVAGTVIEARIIQGQVYLDVNTEQALIEGEERTVLRAVEGTGCQFVQTRGLVVLDSPVGLVACLPVGMAQVSSVVITAELGTDLRKGEEMGYFQFGGSDFVMLFERASNVELRCELGQHYRQGSLIGRAHKAISKH